MIKLALRILAAAAIGMVGVWWVGRLPKEATPIFLIFFGAGVAYHFARDLVEVVPAIARFASRRALEKWNGRFYAYDGHQIRFYRINGVVWIPEEDLQDLLTPAPTDRERRLLAARGTSIPGTSIPGLSEHALLRMLSVRTMNRGGDRAVVRFHHWLKTEALPNVKRVSSSSVNAA